MLLCHQGTVTEKKKEAQSPSWRLDSSEQLRIRQGATARCAAVVWLCTVKKLQQPPSLLPLCPPQSTVSCLPSHAGLHQTYVAFETLRQLQRLWQEAGDKCQAQWISLKPLGSWFYLVPPPGWKCNGQKPKEAPAARWQQGDEFPFVRFLEHSGSSWKQSEGFKYVHNHQKVRERASTNEREGK